MIVAREVSPGLTSLVKKIDAETVKNSGKKMGSFVVFLSDNPSLENDLKALAGKEKLEKLVLAIDNPAGPKAYKVAKEADITVVLYNKSKVQANYAFKKGELKDADIEKIIKDIPKIVP
jgi:hypothetical protein